MTSDEDYRAPASLEVVRACAVRAKQGGIALMGASDAEIDSALRGMAERLGSAQSALMAANEKDLAAAVSAGMSPGCRIACE